MPGASLPPRLSRRPPVGAHSGTESPPKAGGSSRRELIVSRDSVDLPPDLPMYDSLTQALCRAVSDLAPAPPAENHDDVTDLPLPQSGSSGSRLDGDDDRGRPTAAELINALDRLLLVPVAPPLHDLDPHVVARWAENASEALLYRRDRRRLVREVLRVLDEEWATAREIGQFREQIVARDKAHRQREEGTYWERRESGRVARQPIRAEVDPQAWARAKAQARREGLGIGEYVGKLITAEVARRAEGSSAGRRASTNWRREPTRERFFARVAVDHQIWAEFVVRAHEGRVTAARHVGDLVERAAGC